jgi:crotonobetainyl-CoA:carnitine CoA-transferase CaiB-like acyl-CoA transferase
MGKKSAFIDLDKPKDVESIKGLISKSDIFYENYIEADSQDMDCLL